MVDLAEGQAFRKKTFPEIEKKALGDCQRETLFQDACPIHQGRGIGNYIKKKKKKKKESNRANHISRTLSKIWRTGTNKPSANHDTSPIFVGGGQTYPIPVLSKAIKNFLSVAVPTEGNEKQSADQGIWHFPFPKQKETYRIP